MPSTQRTISLATPAPRGTDAAPASSPSECLVMRRPDCGRNFWGLSTARTKNHPNGRCHAHPPPPKITPTGDAWLVHQPRNAPFAAIGLTATPALRGRSWGGRTRTEAGEEGLEPSNGGSKVRCLTTWLLPSGTSDRSQPRPPRGVCRRQELPRRCGPFPGSGVPAAPGALSERSDLDVDARDAQPHAAGPARRGTAAAAAPADRSEPVEARQPARPGPAVGASLGGALIGHGPDHTGATVSRPGVRGGTAPKPEGAPRILRRRWQMHRAR